jgi:hypothetical protein
MITVNDTHHVDKPAPTYRVRKEAVDAAIAVLGPLAIHEFDFITYQLDNGRWDWNVPAEVPPLSAAVIKANGGKKFLAARAQQKGTAMAKTTDGKIGPTKLPFITEDGTFTQEAYDSLAPACNGLDIAPLAAGDTVTYPDGTEGKVLAIGTLNGDDLTIPAFLQRSTPEAKEQAKKAMKRIAKQVGPDRPIKNPPDAKTASKPSPTSVVPGTDTSKWGKDRAERRARRKAKDATSPAPVSDSPKRAKRAGKAKKTLAGHSSDVPYVGDLSAPGKPATFASKAALIKAAIAAGQEDEAIVQAVRAAFPGCEYKALDIRWYRRKMEKAAAGA